ncbi:ATP-binding cassette domain-containing protein [Halomicrococcus sp. NG-SE-24]|uniref:ATP-binding cassette domain-containing protein n=1 Tax=Halomicrococcus sp. NG-SE-24 TaxID=3436928 RepID=UPI003D983ADC
MGETTEDEGDSGEALIEMRSIEKKFGRVQALDGVDLELRENEVLGLVGDNGSGKSTLIKVLVGIHDPDGGEIYIRGKRVRIDNPTDARKHGIATVYQDLALVDEMSVASNIFLGRNPTRRIAGVVELIDWQQMHQRAEEILKNRLNIDLNPTQRVEFLSGGERQAIAIARALVTEPDIVVLDEPTSALSADSASRVHELIRSLHEEGLSIIIISHNIDEIFSLTDRITVLDNAKLVGTVDSESVTKDDVLRMIIEGVGVDEPSTTMSA